MNRLAEILARRVTDGNKTEAVRLALRRELARLVAEESIGQRVAGLQARAAALGLRSGGFDHKSLADDRSGDG